MPRRRRSDQRRHGHDCSEPAARAVPQAPQSAPCQPRAGSEPAHADGDQEGARHRKRRDKFHGPFGAPNFSAGHSESEWDACSACPQSPSSRAKVDLHGSVDEFSPVSINGEVNFLSAALYTDLAMSFRNIELSIFNPYSGKFAGYNISKGKLTTELHYKVDGRKLDAQHHIVIDQLEFGDKTASKDAVSLPIKLAVALLKDRNGVIDLNLPVSGSLDDPKFRLGPIIWKVFVNILEKAVTAPFALLGALFGGGPDLQFIDFHPGTSRWIRGGGQGQGHRQSPGGTSAAQNRGPDRRRAGHRSSGLGGGAIQRPAE